jgi:hypothetical protein
MQRRNALQLIALGAETMNEMFTEAGARSWPLEAGSRRRLVHEVGGTRMGADGAGLRAIGRAVEAAGNVEGERRNRCKAAGVSIEQPAAGSTSEFLRWSPRLSALV